MTENLYYVSDIAKMQELKYKKKPIIAEFYTEYLFKYLDGVHLANLLELLYKNKSNKVGNFYLLV
jgi:hypothetical protein